MKKKYIILIIVLIISIWLIGGYFLITKILDFFRGDTYQLPKDRFANQEEIEEYIRQVIGLNDFELKSKDEDQHKWEYREKNERSVFFTIIQKHDYDSLFGTGDFYPASDNYDDQILNNYILKNKLPDEDYFTRENVENTHSVGERYFYLKGKIVAVYTDNTLETIATNLYNYLLEFYDYNNNLTGMRREIKIDVIFQKKDSELYNHIEIGTSSGCKLSDFVKTTLKTIKK